MHNHSQHGPEHQARLPWYRTWIGLAGLGTGAAAALYLSLYHVTHVLDVLPFLILLLCPLMHLFMHGGHGSSHSGGSDKPGTPNKGDSP